MGGDEDRRSPCAFAEDLFASAIYGTVLDARHLSLLCNLTLHELTIIVFGTAHTTACLES
jgi:hypothetical protein